MIRFVAVGLAVLWLSVVIVSDEARDWGAVDQRPADFVSVSSPERSEFWLPRYVLWSPTGNTSADLAILVSLLVGTAVVLEWWRRQGGKVTRVETLAALLLLTTTLHMFLLSGLLLLAIVLRYRMPARGQPSRRRLAWMLGASVVIGAVWVAYVLVSLPRLDPSATGVSGVGRLLQQVFFDWPQYFRALYRPWSELLPLIGVALVIAVAAQLVSMRHGSRGEFLHQPIFIVIYIATGMALLRPSYIEIRYTFFIYPVILCSIMLGIKTVLDWIGARNWNSATAAQVAACCVYLIIFGISTDFNPDHLLNVSSPDVVYRRGDFERYRRIWYSRLDYASPAAFVEEIPDAESSRVIVVGQPPVSYYLDRQHGVYYDRRDRRFSNVSRAEGTIDLWSGQTLLSTPEDLRWYTREADTVWVIRGTDPRRIPFECATVWGERFSGVSQVLLSEDGQIEVLQVSLGNDASEGIATQSSSRAPDRASDSSRH